MEERSAGGGVAGVLGSGGSHDIVDGNFKPMFEMSNNCLKQFWAASGTGKGR
jgi:hypothetical protein